MLVTVKIGNSEISLVAWPGEGDAPVGPLRFASDRDVDVATLASRFVDTSGAQFPMGRITSVRLAGVAAGVTETALAAVEAAFGVVPEQVTNRTDLGLRIAYNPPDSVGVDRLLNASAARHIAAQDQSSAECTHCIVLDFGTATTLEVVTLSGTYLGGVIAPGMGISVDALHAKAPSLPRIELETLDDAQNIIGASTRDCLRAGILHGAAAQTEGLVSRVVDSLGRSRCAIFLTGGWSRLVSPLLPQTPHRWDPLLLHHGLRLLEERTQ